VFERTPGAATRGILVVMLIATPSMLLPAYTLDAPEIVVFLAILAGILTFTEYNSNFPSYIEFRDAPPMNRLRFTALFCMVFVLSVISKHHYEPTNLTAIFAGLGRMAGDWVDFPYSPVRLLILMLPEGSSTLTVNTVRVAAGVAYLIALVTVASFMVSIRVMGWPTSNGAFNVWINLPLFDPTTGGDVVSRMRRDGRINIILGVLLPFVIPALIKAASDLIGPIPMTDPQTVIWTISAWAFLSTSMIMRGMAMSRIAALVEEKRRRTYANAEAMQVA